MRKIIILGTLAVLGLAATAQADDTVQTDGAGAVKAVRLASNDDGRERGEWTNRRERTERSGSTHEARERAERSSRSYEQHEASEHHDESREHGLRR